MAKHKHIGSDFDDFLKEEGILEEVEAAAAKRTFVIQFEHELKKKKIGKSKLAKLMKTSRPAIDRLLDPKQPSTLTTLSGAALAVGKHLRVSLV
jgi:antitoxin HicB